VSKPPLSFDQLMAIAQELGLGNISLESLARDQSDLAEQLGSFDPVKVAATFAGLLTVPELQSNCVRLEALVHLGLALGNGARKPGAKHIAQWFATLGKGRCGAIEDPAEDIFVGSIATQRGNYRVLEGIWESGTFYLQRIVNVVEDMPPTGAFGDLRESVYALLVLSEALCARAELSRYQLGNPQPERSLPLRFANTADKLRRRVCFTQPELERLGIALSRLNEFVFDPDDADRLIDGAIGHTLLERFPVAWHKGTFHFALPTATSAAIRRFVIERVNALGIRKRFLEALASEYSNLIRTTLLLGKIRQAPVHFRNGANGQFASVMTPVDRGRYLSFVFFADALDGFDESGLIGHNPNPEQVGDEIGELIDQSHQEAANRPDFRDGMTLVTSCGIGRVTDIALEKKERAGWRVGLLRAADLVTLSWLPDMSPLFLWKILDGYDRLASLGVTLQNVNGLLNLVAWVRAQGGHLVPHGAVPVDFGADDRPSFIMIEQNGLRRLRHEAATSWDPHVVQNIQGDWVRVRKPEQSQFKEDLDQPLYASEERSGSGWPLGVYITTSRPWWCELEVAKGVEGYIVYQRWKMITLWLSRIAPVLDRALANLPRGAVLWRVKFDADIGQVDKEVEPIDFEEAKAEIAVNVEANKKTVVMVASPRFEGAHFNERNIAERAIVARAIDGFAQLAGQALSQAEHLAIVGAIVPDDRARQTHMFRAREFRDYVRSSVPPTPITIDTVDGATLKLGLGWRVRDRKLGGDIDGKENCVRFLNSMVGTLEGDLCDQLRKFDREAAITLALINHESAAIDQAIWMRTASAVLSLHSDKQSAADTIARHEYKLNAVFLATRLVIEFALCECPVEGGLNPGQLDLTQLMAKAISLPAYGGWSDAIRWEAMEPILKIRPLGDIHAKTADFEEIVATYGRAGTDLRVSDAVENYGRNLEEIEGRKSVEDALDPAFLAAWEEEFGASVDDVRRFIDCIEDLGIASKQAVLKLSKSQLGALKIAGEALPPATAEAVVEALIFRSRPRWRDVPDGYDDRDRHPWRFRRRLTVLRKPLIQIDERDDPTILVAPGILRMGFAYMLGGYFRGRFSCLAA
jgi:hypothetical protein